MNTNHGQRTQPPQCEALRFPSAGVNSELSRHNANSAATMRSAAFSERRRG
jgi:hypothetical protein